MTQIPPPADKAGPEQHRGLCVAAVVCEHGSVAGCQKQILPTDK